MTARDDTLAAAKRLAVRSADGTFSLTDILNEVRRSGSDYAESTIRTHVTSRMCANAPDHHAVTYDDLFGLGDGKYRLNT